MTNKELSKQELIAKVKHLNPLRNTTSWNKMQKEELQSLYNEMTGVMAQ